MDPRGGDAQADSRIRASFVSFIIKSCRTPTVYTYARSLSIDEFISVDRPGVALSPSRAFAAYLLLVIRCLPLECFGIERVNSAQVSNSIAICFSTCREKRACCRIRSQKGSALSGLQCAVVSNSAHGLCNSYQRVECYIDEGAFIRAAVSQRG
jgi:hypothetical protein